MRQWNLNPVNTTTYTFYSKEWEEPLSFSEPWLKNIAVDVYA